MISRPHEVASDALRLGIRAAGGPGVGAGHLVRCLALAQAWLDRGGSVVLETVDAPAAWASAYGSEGIDVLEPGAGRADAWVVDGYDLDVPAVPGPVLRIDDGGRSPAAGATVVLDQNLGAAASSYEAHDSQLLLGPTYALLRRDLAVAAQGLDAAAPDLRPVRVLLAAGGAPRPEVAEAFADVADRVRAGGGEVVTWSGADDPLPALTTCHVALAASGSTVWELCAFGIASVVVAVADNQQPIARALGAAAVAVDGGDLLGAAAAGQVDRLGDAVEGLVGDAAARRELADRGRALVDGRGAARVAEVVWELAVGSAPSPVTDARTTTT